jgi:hypothetical protein
LAAALALPDDKSTRKPPQSHGTGRIRIGFGIARRQCHRIIAEKGTELVEQLHTTTELAFAAFLLGLAYWEWVCENPV